MELDFTGLNRIAYGNANTPEERQEKDELLEKGCVFVQADELPFEEPPAAGNQENKVELRQIFSLQDTLIFCELYSRGKIELLEPLHLYRTTGALYAHFMLTLEDSRKSILEDAQAVSNGGQGNIPEA